MNFFGQNNKNILRKYVYFSNIILSILKTTLNAKNYKIEE